MSDSQTEIQPPTQPGEWFCDQCGARYPEDGVCTGTPTGGQHAPAELKPVEQTASPAETAPADGSTGTVVETAAVETPPADAGTTIVPVGVTSPEAAVSSSAAAESLVAQACDELEQAIRTARDLLGI